MPTQDHHRYYTTRPREEIYTPQYPDISSTFNTLKASQDLQLRMRTGLKRRVGRSHKRLPLRVSLLLRRTKAWVLANVPFHLVRIQSVE